MLWPSRSWDSVTYWALDIETGGMDPRRDPILAVGMLPIRSGHVHLGEAFESLVRPEALEVIRPDSMRAHHLVPRDVREAPRLEMVLREVDRRVREGALLVHHATIDIRFLRRAYRAHRMRWPDPRVVDTVKLLLRIARREFFLDPDATRREPELNLGAVRRRFGLPDYEEHNPLMDALATAELFLVLRQQLGARTLRELI